jgi:DNA/RNA-binding domain of Phe-tRNA-synthetase-like protein
VTLSFSVSPQVLDLGVRVACFALYDVDNASTSPECEAWLAAEFARLKVELDGQDSTQHPVLTGFRDLHVKINKTGKRWISSPENLRLLMAKTLSFPRINKLVDLYNAFSLRTGIALGAHDIDAISGNVTLRMTKGDERFLSIGASEPEKIAPGEYAYCDDSNEVLCRLEVRQVEKTKFTPQSRNVFFIVQGNANTDQASLSGARDALAQLVTSHCGGRFVQL